MTKSSTARYCRCGTRLGRDHRGGPCSPCEKRLTALRSGPPDAPAEFWETDQLREAFAAQHIGQVSRAYRKHPRHLALYGKDGIPQTIVADWLGLTQAQVSRIENGPPVRHLDNLAHWARRLRIPEHLLWFQMPGAEAHVSENLPVLAGAVPMPTAAFSPPMYAHFGQTASDEGADASVMEAFRAADKQVGGGHLYASVVSYLHTNVAPRLFGGSGGNDNGLTYNGAAALTEMAGWMAHDAGRDESARQHFHRSLDLVRVGGDVQLGAHILASTSHLAHHVGQPEQAIRHAQRGQEVLAGTPRQPALEARLLALQARGFATLGQSRKCTLTLSQAEKVLEDSPEAAPSPWISPFDEGALASEAARCMRQLGDLDEARRQAERIIALRPGDRRRSRAFGQLMLVSVLVGQGRPDEACSVAGQVLEATQSLGSYLVLQELQDLKQLLEPYAADKVVAEFLACLGETLRERLSFYQWLSATGAASRLNQGRGA